LHSKVEFASLDLKVKRSFEPSVTAAGFVTISVLGAVVSGAVLATVKSWAGPQNSGAPPAGS
jgi:hypothetical protein